MQTAAFGSPARSDSAKQWDVNTGRTVFSRLMDFLPAYEFQKCVSLSLANCYFAASRPGCNIVLVAFVMAVFHLSWLSLISKAFAPDSIFVMDSSGVQTRTGPWIE
jgi:hypothetical protein